MNKKSGFTLAEVLITLVIIGVIAAMTIPTLMNSTNAQEYKTGIKKGISTLNQALTMQYALEGSTLADSATSTDAVVDIFQNRLNVISTSVAGETLGGVAVNPVFYTADGMKFGVVAAATGTCDTAGASSCFQVIIDVNGDKKPNAATTQATRPQDIYSAILYAQRAVPYDHGSIVTQGVMFEEE